MLLAQNEVDTLLDRVADQVYQNTFPTSDRQLLEQVVECLGDTRGVVRLRCAQTLGEIGKPATPVLVEALLHHENVVVRRAAAKTLTLIADPSSIPALIQALLNDEDTVVKGSSVGALARMGESAVPVLLEILSSPDNPESTKGHAAWALAFLGAEAKEYLYQQIDSELPEVRCAIIGAIAKLTQEQPEERAFKLIITGLGDRAESVRCEAASALGNLAYQQAIPNLIPLLTHENQETRKAAALALMKIGEPSAIDALKVALEQETAAPVQTVINLAISQLEKKSISNNDDDW